MKRLLLIFGASTLVISVVLLILLASGKRQEDTGKPKYITTCNDETNIPRLSKEVRIEQLQKFFDGIHIPFGEKKTPAPAGHIVQFVQ